MSDDKALNEELVDVVARAMWFVDTDGVSESDWPAWAERYFHQAANFRMSARAAVRAMRSYDREQRANIDTALAAAIADAKPCLPFVPTSKNNGPPKKVTSTYYDIINDCYHVQFADGTSEVVRAADLDKRRRSRAPSPEALARHNEAQHGGMNMYVETRHDPDDCRDLHLVTRMASGPGITEG